MPGMTNSSDHRQINAEGGEQLPKGGVFAPAIAEEPSPHTGADHIPHKDGIEDGKHHKDADDDQ